MPSTDDWTMPVLTCLVCDKDRDPLDAPDEPCGHGREYRHVVLVPVMPRRVTDEMVDRAAEAYEIGGACGESKACGHRCASAHEHRMRLALVAALGNKQTGGEG